MSPNTSNQTITIGGASGFWGDAALATPQLLATEKLDYLVYDYLAEVTMSIMARARKADDDLGYATDFVSVAMKPNLKEIARQGVKVIANAGGVNPRACATALNAIIAEQGLDLTVAVVLGDDLIDRAEEFAAREDREMFSGDSFPAVERVASINAYLGAFPIAKALDQGADIVVTGRCVDSAVTLGACIHAFGWQRDDYDKLAQASLAGHILECGTQATGGNYTDWEDLDNSFADAGYPMAEVSACGGFDVFKPEPSGGAVTNGTVAEQMLYEIGDPQRYQLPDVNCDFSEVELHEIDTNRVRVTGARGHGAPDSYKTSATWSDGFRSGQIWAMYGRDAERKARLFADTVFKRTATRLEQLGLGPLTETSIEIIGTETHFGAAAQQADVREADIKIAAKHPNPKAIGIFLKEMTGVALTAPPGLVAFTGAGRAKPSPVVRLFSLLVPKQDVDITVEINGESFTCKDTLPQATSSPSAHAVPTARDDEEMIEVPLEALAWGRSGDKGNKANIGIIARDAAFVPYIAAKLTESYVANYFAHFLTPEQDQPCQRFYMPGSHAFNFLLHDILGGGGIASLRYDAQGKGYAQLLLAESIAIPKSLASKARAIN
ncbi:MAG: DUF1446 domain-containing protein [Candidatus Pelagadaptatus aseana]|uniref:acyclic terpene utilization AtuA family protein n=1 Tax=Candidatus Pelagadaptatus aseana TaxID=3120508 RepID=UPI0039B2B711